ncbi:K02A2.6-like [Cordylochernes scorpioides]|uniref:RNA-directed DNA polymerase n=1 Tax=Cordylochernes scorpioides TaxID=51811 RepID=A0ABY6KQE4_9ARAC|nr:K02A2.6-like [Cordylochernes scorpioides]
MLDEPRCQLYRAVVVEGDTAGPKKEWDEERETLEQVLPLGAKRRLPILGLRFNTTTLLLSDWLTYLGDSFLIGGTFSRGRRLLVDLLSGYLDYLQQFHGLKSSHADTIQEHNKKLKGILEKAKEKNIKFDLTKAQICLTKVRFLGHVISQNGIDPEPNKIDKLITFKRPEDKKSLQRIMGLYNYLGKFIPNLAASTSNIRGILRKNVVWHWGPKQDGEFDHIKECVRNAPSLAHFDKSKMLILQCDASKDAMGAALLQEDRPLAFASASFSDSQKQYSQIEKELLSVYYGCKKFEYLLSGHTFVVQTDHQPLLPLVKKPLSDISPRLQRLVMKLIAFDFKLQYKPGKYLIVADTLSRDTHPMDELPTPFLEDKRMVKMVRVNISDEKLVAMQKDTREDPALVKVIDYVIEGWPICKKDVDEDAKVFFDFRHRLYLWNDLLCIGSAIVIPKTQRNNMLNLLHQSHQGISAIQGLARESLFWPRMSIDIAEKVKNCEICQKHQKSKIRQPLKPFPVPDYPWQTVSLDIFYIQKKPHLLVVDRYSGYPEVFTLDPPTAINVKNKLRETFARFGIPETMMSDNGPPFRSEIMTDFCIRWGIKQLFSSPHLHRSNGLAERNIQTIKNQLIKCRDEGSDPYLAILAYRNTPKNDLPSPAQLCLSRSLRCQIPRITPLYRPYQTNWRSIENAKRKRQSSMKEQYDRNTQDDSPQSFEVVTPSGNRLIRNQQFIRPRDGGYEKRQLSSEPITDSPEAQHPQCDSPTMGESSTAPIQRSSEETNIDQREGATTSAGIAPEPSGRPRFSSSNLPKEYKRCTFARNGCDYTFLLDKDRRIHESRCVYQEDECPQCAKQILRKDMGRHIEENCDNRIETSRACSEQFIAKDFLEESGIQKKVKCKVCNNQILAYAYNKHASKCSRNVDIGSNQGFDMMNGSDFLSKDITKCLTSLVENVKSLKDENTEIRDILTKMKHHMGYLANDVEILKFLIAEKDGTMVRVYHDMELAQVTMEKEKDTFTECLNEQNNFNIEIKEKVEEFEKKLNTITGGMIQTPIQKMECKMENLNLSVGCGILAESRLLSDISRQISLQLYWCPSSEQIVTIYPGISVDKRIRWKDCGPVSILKSNYCYKLTQDKYGTYLILSFSIYQQCPDKWIPPEITHSMCVLMDPEELKVIYYAVEEKKPGYERATGMNYVTFGPYKITRELYQQLKAKTHCNKLHSAFILYNIEGKGVQVAMIIMGRKRRRGSGNSPTTAAPSSNAGASRTIRRPQSSAGSVPRAQEIRATRAHIADARARQASSSEEHCVYIEHSPELEPFHYLRALDRKLGGTAGVIQITKVNCHQLLGLTNRGLAERLISEGLEVEGTLLRAFPFRKRAERITVGNLPFFVADSAVITALSPYGRVTSIAPKQMKAGPYVYVDGRRDVFITLHEGITIERLPTRLDINIKGQAWPAYLSSGIRCSRCHGQGHRRAICPLLAGLANNTRMAPPTTPAGVPPPTTSAPPQRSAAQPPAPAPSNLAMEVCSAPPMARAVLHPSAPRSSPPAAPALPMEETPSAPPPVIPAPSLQAPEGSVGPRSANSQHPEPPPARPDFVAPRDPLPAQKTFGPAAPTPDVEMSIVEETSASSTSLAKNATRVDLDAFIERHPSVSFAGTDALGVSSRTKAQRKGPLLSPPQCDALAGLIGQILDLRPGAASNHYQVLGQVKAELRTTPAAVPTPPPPAPRPAETTSPALHGERTSPDIATPPPPLSTQFIDACYDQANDIIYALSRERFSEPLSNIGVTEGDIVEAIIFPEDREPLFRHLSTQKRTTLAEIISAASERARNSDPFVLKAVANYPPGLSWPVPCVDMWCTYSKSSR